MLIGHSTRDAHLPRESIVRVACRRQLAFIKAGVKKEEEEEQRKAERKKRERKREGNHRWSRSSTADPGRAAIFGTYYCDAPVDDEIPQDFFARCVYRVSQNQQRASVSSANAMRARHDSARGKTNLRAYVSSKSAPPIAASRFPGHPGRPSERFRESPRDFTRSV